MPNVTVSSLKKENDSPKDEITAFRRNLEELQQSIKRQDPQVTSNGGEQPTRLIKDAESLSTLEFYGKSYDDLRPESVNSLKQLWSRLSLLSFRVGKIGDSIEQLQRYSFQCNMKIIDLPERETQESASQTASLCINLFKAAGIEISNQDIDIAHRIPTRIATSGPRPIVCKFTRRIMKEQVMNARTEACKMSANSIGLPSSCSWKTSGYLIALLPCFSNSWRIQRNFKGESSSSAGPRTLLFIFDEPKTLARSKSSATTTL